MAKMVTISVDADSSTLGVFEGRVFLGTKTEVEFDGWTADDGCRAVLTLFAGGCTPVASATTDADGRTWLDLTGTEVRKAFHGEPARHAFKAYLNQREGADGDYLPDVEAEGTMWVEWSPEVFEVTDDGSAIAALRGPAGPMGPQGVQGPKGDKGDKGDTPSLSRIDDLAAAIGKVTSPKASINSLKTCVEAILKALKGA